jgi:hypothetical protein
VKHARGCVNGVVPLFTLDAEPGVVQSQDSMSMATTRTRLSLQPLMRLAGASAFILFVAIFILPR